MMLDPLPDPTITLANWYAMACFGREELRGDEPTSYVLNGVRLSMRSVALLFAAPAWLLCLWDVNQ